MTGRLRLYCFPHSGATASVYRPWQTMAGPTTDIRPVDRPGRGLRTREPAAASLSELVEACAREVLADLADDPHVPWMTFGHSFGSVVSLATAAAVAEAGRAPVRAIVSAGLPPAQHSAVDEAAGLDDEALLAQISDIGGTPKSLLGAGPVRDRILRHFREDHAIRSQFSRQRGLRVDIPLSIISARGDTYAPPDRMSAWAEHSTVPSEQVSVDGDHFAVMRDPQPVWAVIHRHITREGQHAHQPG
ncbi:thioesterase II family protein [Phytoactinopolyspora mesophila]|uniref:Thioesterase n=1 Tax=Phytoactinopolyspora mesophila TaxID=2650750 RepID=A0A7K3LXS5_9ACTN|nr:thioesterase [Phytoactinopolyspora mesophila]NDL55831.1 thioesterase [Phytoactinopolyspora mesophila]